MLKKFSILSSIFGGIAFHNACNMSITRHIEVSAPSPNRLRSYGPTRTSSSIEIPAARPTPKKEFPRRGAGHPRSVHRAQNSGGSKDVYLVSLLRWRGSVDEIPRREGSGEGGERPVGYSIPRAWIAHGLCGVTLVPP